MATVTLATIRDTVRFRGTFENSAKFTDARLLVEINAAYAELFELIADSNEGFWDTTASASTVAAQDWVALPADFWRLRGVDILIGGKYSELSQIGIADRNKFQTSTGRPIAYRLASGSARGRIILYPTPSGVESLRFVYTPTFTPLALDADTVEGYNEWTDFIIAGTLLRLYQREERPLGEIQQELARLTARIIKGASQRRAAEPETIPLGRDLDRDDLDYFYWWA